MNDAQREELRSSAEPVAWWDRAVGGFYLSKASIPKIAWDRGGMAELCLFPPDAAAMAARIKELEAEAVPEGYKIVPEIPTHEMCVQATDVFLTDWYAAKDSAGKDVMQVRECSAHDIYVAMLTAAPVVPVAAGTVDGDRTNG